MIFFIICRNISGDMFLELRESVAYIHTHQRFEITVWFVAKRRIVRLTDVGRWGSRRCFYYIDTIIFRL